MAYLSLVGAGPGDPELITLKAVNVLRQADVILYDALVNEALLAYAKPGAVIRFVGKRYGCHSLSQQEINHLIVSYARSRACGKVERGRPFCFWKGYRGDSCR